MIDETRVLELAIEHTIKHFVENDHSEDYEDFVKDFKYTMIERARCHLDIDPEPTEYKLEDKWKQARVAIRVWEMIIRANQESGTVGAGDRHKEKIIQYIRNLERQLGIPIEELNIETV